MAIDLAALTGSLKERVFVFFGRRQKLLDKAMRDPRAFLADARSPVVRRAGALADSLGVLPSVEAHGLPARGPRGLGLGHEDPGVEAPGDPVIAGALAAVQGNRVTGYARAPRAHALLAVTVGDVTVARFFAAQVQAPSGDRVAFDVCIDLGASGAKPGELVSVGVVCSRSGDHLAGSPRAVRVPRYEGALGACERGRVQGRVRDVVTGHPVHLDVRVDGRTVARPTVEARDHLVARALERWRGAFLATYDARRTDERFAVYVRGVHAPLFGPARFEEETAPVAAPFTGPVAAPPVHVIIPVYAGLEDSLRCVDSVLEARNETPCEISVIFDHGPERALLEALRERARGGRFTLTENAENLGFVRTCNRAMRAKPDLDVLLLNADAEVSDGYLDRLARAARSGEDVGTATPFSNAATICTYPVMLEERPLDAKALDELSARFAALNAGETVDLPSGHGFCLFIRRAMLDRVGLFDEAAFGRGYGEENDLCLRASALGFRHVLACDAFVRHVGSVSFGAERRARVQHALSVIAHRYPTYQADVARFVRTDPAAKYRNRVIVEQLRDAARRSPNGAFLHVTHHLGGGVMVHVRDLAERLLREGVMSLVLRSDHDGAMRLATPDGSLTAVYPGTTELLRDLAEIGLRHVHFHAWLTFEAEVLAIPERLGVAYDVSLHDYFAACPRVNFVRADGTYCGEPEVSACELCIAVDGPKDAARFMERSPARSVAAHRAMHAQFLAGARRVLTPSEDTKRRATRAFPSLPMYAQALPEHPAEARFARGAPGRVRVAVLGAIELHKGYRELLAVAEHAHRTSLPIEIVVFGTTVDTGTLRALPNVRVTGRYERADLEGMVRESGCTVAALFSICPETFSFVLTEALTLGLYPLAFDIGAPAERIRAFGHGTVLPMGATPETICEALLTAHERIPEGTFTVPARDYASILRDFYALEP